VQVQHVEFLDDKLFSHSRFHYYVNPTFKKLHTLYVKGSVSSRGKYNWVKNGYRYWIQASQNLLASFFITLFSHAVSNQGELATTKQPHHIGKYLLTHSHCRMYSFISALACFQCGFCLTRSAVGLTVMARTESIASHALKRKVYVGRWLLSELHCRFGFDEKRAATTVPAQTFDQLLERVSPSSTPSMKKQEQLYFVLCGNNNQMREL